MDRPIRPTTRPGIDRPGFTRPGIDRPGITRPGITRPGGSERPAIDGRPGRPGRPGTRPAIDDRPIDVGDINLGNNAVISTRPSWVNADRRRIDSMVGRWQNQVGRIHNWHVRNPHRIHHWERWGNRIRHHWHHHHHHHHWFGRDWWIHHHHHWAGWHYGHCFDRYRWSYWWRVPTFTACVNWFAWPAPSTVWSQPIYYDYGTGGNVVIQNNVVTINGQQVATVDEFAQSAMELATVEPPASEEEAREADWLPLGTFAVSTGEKDVEPSRVIQLAVNKQGIVSGTLYNSQTDQAHSVQGQVDKQTQRVALRFGESDRIVVETGLYNLTQEEAPILVHFGTDRVENWLFVRLENAEAEQ